MPKFRRKPVIVEAMQIPHVLDIDGRMLFEAWVEASIPADRRFRWVGEGIAIETLEGKMRATAGDWIILGVEGEVYPCKESIFPKIYEAA